MLVPPKLISKEESCVDFLGVFVRILMVMGGERTYTVVESAQSSPISVFAEGGGQ